MSQTKRKKRGGQPPAPPPRAPSPFSWRSPRGQLGETPALSHARIGDVISVALAAVSLVLHLAVDSVGAKQSDSTVPLCIVMAVLMAVSAPLSHLLARVYLPGRLLWQPFRGGPVFVILQSIGWAFFSFWLMCASVVVNSSIVARAELQQLPVRSMAGQGFLSFVGGIGFTGVVLLAISSNHFESAVRPLRLLGMTPAAMVALGVAVGSFAMLTVLDLAGATTDSVFDWTDVVAIFCAGILFANGFFIHTVVGKLTHGPAYKLLQPLEGGLRYVLAQMLGWSMLSICTYLLMHISPATMPRGAFSVLGCGLLVANLLLLNSLAGFEKSGDTVVLSSLAGSSSAVVLLLTGLLSLSVMAAAEFMYRVDTAITLTPANLAWPAAAVQWLLPPITHYRNSFSTKGYFLFRPFGGGPNFVAVQMLGWMTYSLSLAAFLLYALNGFTWGFIGPAFFSFVSEVILMLSPRFVDPKTLVPGPSGPWRRNPVNGEILLSTVLCFAAVGVFVVVDNISESDLPFHRSQLLLFGVLALLVAPVIVHCSGSRMYQSYKKFQPFVGGAEFVALQAIAWTLYGIQILFHSMILFNFDFLVHAASGYFISMCGVFGLAPWLMIWLSVRFFDSDPGSPACSARRVTVSLQLREAVPELAGLESELQQLVQSAENPLLKELLEGLKGECELKVAAGALRDDGGLTVEHGGKGIVLIATGCIVISIFFFLLTDLFVAIIPKEFWGVVVASFITASVPMLAAPLLVHLFVGPARHAEWQIWQPFKGGFNFVLLQVLGWSLYGSAVCMCILLAVNGLDTAGVIGVFVVVAILGGGAHCAIVLSVGQFAKTPADLSSDSFLQRHPEWCVSVLLTFSACTLFVAFDRLRVSLVNVFPVTPLIVLAVVALVASVPLAFIAVRKARRPVHSAAEDDFEPVGGVSELFALVMAFFQLSAAAVAGYHCVIRVVEPEMIQGLIFAAVVFSGIAQVAFYLAMFYYEGKSLGESLAGALRVTVTTFVTCTLYCMPLLIYFLWLSVLLWKTTGAYMFFTWMHFATFTAPYPMGVAMMRALCALSATHAAYDYDWDRCVWSVAAFLYEGTYTNSHRTGSRLSARWRGATAVWECLASYFSLRVIAEDGAKEAIAKAGNGVLFGWHPHGIYPWTCQWCVLTNAWKEQVGVSPTAHAATVLFGAPVLRDVALNLGALDVSYRCLDSRLRKGCPTLLVPGGQAEMWVSRSWGDLKLLRRHKGFIKLAIRHGTPLVPIFSFGDAELMDNINMPEMQRWFLKRIGFGYPHFPYGRQYLPVPRRRPLTVVVGRPLEVEQKDAPTAEEVNKVHRMYFATLEALYHKYKGEAGCTRRLVFVD